MKQSKGTAIYVPAIVLLVLVFCTHTTVAAASARDNTPVAWWKFDKGQDRAAADSASGIQDEILGFFKYVKGTSGDALRFDGYSTVLRRKANNAPKLGKSFSIEAWVAFQAYPWGMCAIVGQCQTQDVQYAKRTRGSSPPQHDPAAGYYFAADARGRIHLQVFVNGKWTQCQSEDRIGLLEWAHIAGTYDAVKGLTIYINGTKSGSTPAKGNVMFASDLDLLVGRNHSKRRPANPVGSIVPSLYSFDGYIDEVKIHDRALTPGQIDKTYEATKPAGETGMEFRKLPTEPAGPAPFGAYYTNIKFHETWDALRREGAHPDVVVLFDNMPWRFIFWRGSGFIPFWVTENNIWYTNEFNETWPPVDQPNVYEPMSDKQTRTSHVRIIENTDARVVIHWRYALVNTLYQIAYEDPLTGWGDWADEYDIIYPDGVGIRKQKVWTSRTDQPHEFQESIVLSAPGTRPEDNIEPGAFTVMNMDGKMYTYSFANGPPEPPSSPQSEDPFGAQVAFVKELAYPNIQIVNTKSKARSFLIVSDSPFDAPWPVFAKVDGPLHFPYTHGRINWEHCMFTWWNHWPVAQIPSDGRTAYDPDRVSHTAVSNWFWKEYESTPDSQVKISMHGLTEKHPTELATLARSWLRAPKLFNRSRGFSNKGYDQAQRAYVFECHDPDEKEGMRFELPASDEQPLVNPAFLIKNWGNDDITLEVNRQPIERGKALRYGYVQTPTGADLVIWIELEETKHTDIRISPKDD